MYLEVISEVSKRIVFIIIIIIIYFILFKSFFTQFLFDHVVTKNSHFTCPLGWKEHLYCT